jgi:hypothetical protein
MLKSNRVKDETYINEVAIGVEIGDGIYAIIEPGDFRYNYTTLSIYTLEGNGIIFEIFKN